MTSNNEMKGSPAPRPGTTRLPNHFVDFVMQDLSHPELLVYLFLLRRTVGFQRESDRISTDQMISGMKSSDGEQLNRGVGLGRTAVRTALVSLEKRGLITRKQNSNSKGGSAYTEYGVSAFENTGVTTVTSPCVAVTTPANEGVAVTTPGVSPSRHQQNKLIPKETSSISNGTTTVARARQEEQTQQQKPGEPEPTKTNTAFLDCLSASRKANPDEREKLRKLAGDLSGSKRQPEGQAAAQPAPTQARERYGRPVTSPKRPEPRSARSPGMRQFSVSEIEWICGISLGEAQAVIGQNFSENILTQQQ